jgi:hypothetical protein
MTNSGPQGRRSLLAALDALAPSGLDRGLAPCRVARQVALLPVTEASPVSALRRPALPRLARRRSILATSAPPEEEGPGLGHRPAGAESLA